MARTVKEYFEAMPAAFQKDVAARLNAIYQFDLGGEGGGKWFVQLSDGALEVGEGEKEKPDVVVTALATDYVEIAEGRMNPMLAMVTGKFKISGNLGLAMKLQQLFKR